MTITSSPSFPPPTSTEIEGSEWPESGWIDDIRPQLRHAIEQNIPVALATLYKVEGSAPRGPGAQMLFTANDQGGISATGYFSGDCIEGDLANHAAQVLQTGESERLHYGLGSPWIDLRLRCGGALHILLERITPDSAAAQTLLKYAAGRIPCTWLSDGHHQEVSTVNCALLELADAPFRVARRYDPARRLIVSGGDPGALAVVRLSHLAQFETILLRPDGPHSPPPFPISQYLREEPSIALDKLGLDRWTAYLGATHEDHHDLGGCLSALRGGAGYVAMIGAKSRATNRLNTLAQSGATEEELSRLRLSPGITGLGKSPWEVATGILAEIMQALNPAHERA